MHDDDVLQAYALQALTMTDINQCHALSAMLGWNTPPQTWQRLLHLGQGYGIWHGKRLVATAIAIPYQAERGWLANIITDPDYRRQGLGERVTRAAVAHLQEQGIEQILLDATELGAYLYQKLGFRPIDTVEAWFGTAEASSGPVLPQQVPDVEQIIRLDARGFGVERRDLIATLAADFPGLAWVDGDDGFLLARYLDDDLARIGPWNHTQEDGAEVLLRTALHHLAGYTVRVDIPASNERAKALVQKAGFSFRFSCQRMLLGEVEFLSKEYGISATATG